MCPSAANHLLPYKNIYLLVISFVSEVPTWYVCPSTPNHLLPNIQVLVKPVLYLFSSPNAAPCSSLELRNVCPSTANHLLPWCRLTILTDGLPHVELITDHHHHRHHHCHHRHHHNTHQKCISLQNHLFLKCQYFDWLLGCIIPLPSNPCFNLNSQRDSS